MINKLIQIIFVVFVLGSVNALFTSFGENKQTTNMKTPQSTPEAIAEETKSECIDRVTNELIERDRGEVVTKEKMELYYAEYIGRCNLTPNR